MNTYTIMIERFIVDNNIPDRPNYVTRIIARVHGVAPSGKGALLMGGFDVSGQDPTSGEFIPVDQLTPEIAESWIKAASEGSQWAQFTADIDQMISNQATAPQVTEIVPPWLQPTVENLMPTIEAVSPVEIDTSSSNTATNLSMSMNVNEQTLRAMIYQVLEEINSSTV